MSFIVAVQARRLGGRLRRSAHREAATFAEALLRWAYPALCRACQAPLGDSPTLCPECWARIPLWHGIRCERCGIPTRVPCETCTACPPIFGHRPFFGRLRAATPYREAVRAAIHAAKYEARPRLARRLGQLILDVDPPLCDWGTYAAIVPIPLHRVRQAERGFNQAAEIARTVGRAVGVPVQPRWIRRIRPTTPMFRHPDAAMRRREIDGAFRARLPQNAKGSRLLLLDDVVTSGATASEAARVLLEAGAEAVDVVCVARAMRFRNGTYDDGPQEDASATTASIA